MTYKIPGENKKIYQSGKSDVLGNIWSSMNLDLYGNEGRIRVSPRGMIVSNSVDLPNMGLPVDFKFYRHSNTDRIWCIAGQYMFYNSGDPDDNFTQDATAGTPTNLNDSCSLELFNGSMWVVGNGDLTKFDGAWTVVSTSPNGGDATTCVYGGRLYFTQSSSQIASVNTSEVLVEPSGTPNTVPFTVNISDFGAGGSNANKISCIRASSNRIWIATVDSSSQSHGVGRRAKVFEWDGAATQTNKVYHIDSIGAMSLIIKGDVPFIMDANGRLLKFNGREFAEVARLPVDPSRYLRNPVNSVGQRFIHPNGMTIRDNKILMLINNLNEISTDTINENLPAGIWEYDDDNGTFVHKYSCSLWEEGVDSTRKDYAQNRIGNVGALYFAKSTDDSILTDGDIMWGAEYQYDGSSPLSNVRNAIFTNNTRDIYEKMGYFVTTKIDSQGVQDMWQKIIAKYKRFLDSSDRISLKYRTYETTPIEYTITWTSTTTFTLSGDITSTWAVGDEVEITQGTGGGQCEHISAMSYSSGTGLTTVTMDREFTGATGTAVARFQKWIKICDITDMNQDFKESPIGVKSNWVQIKCVMYFKGKDELNEIAIINEQFKQNR